MLFGPLDKAKRFQPRDHAPRVLARKAAPRLKASILQALKHARALVDPKKLVPLLAHGRIRAAVEHVPFQHLREVFKVPFDEVASTFEAAGDYGAGEISRAFQRKGIKVRYGRFTPKPSARRKPAPVFVRKDTAAQFATIGDRFDFDRFDANTQAAIRRYQDQLIAELEKQARDSVEQAIRFGITTGMSIEDIAASIRDSISLTARQAQAVNNFRRLIENGDSAALSRALRDTSFDNVLESIIDGDADVAQSVIDQMVERYAENYLDYRAQTIADTESLRASQYGITDSYRQAVDRGAIPEDSLTRQWQLVLDERLCDVCAPIPDMNPEGVGINEFFDTPDGPVDDPPIHPSCRCTVDMVTDLDMIPPDES